MKRNVSRLALLLALAPVVLMGCAEKKNEGATQAATPSEAAPTSAPAASQPAIPSGDGLRIAWVNMDSVLQAYDMYFDMQQEMQRITAKAEQEVASKGKALEKRVAEFQTNMQKGLLTRSEAQRTQEELGKEQQHLMQIQEQQRQKVMEEEQVRLRKVQNAIQEFIKEYNREKGYSYILSVGMLYADPQMNITRQVVDGLNAAYATQRKGQPTE